MDETRTAIHIGLGGTDEVGASSHLYLFGATKLLIDAGLRPGMIGGDALPSLEALKEHPPTAMLLTHAHLDHVGALPLVIRRFRELKVYATPLTIELAGAVMRDTLKIGLQQGHPLFNAGDVGRAMGAFVPIGYDQAFTLGSGEDQVGAVLRPAGHLPGAAQVELHWRGRHFLHAGDVSNIATALTDPAWLPEPGSREAGGWDAVTCESTYGDTALPSRKAQVQELVRQLREVTAAGGRVLIPTFALGRAQEILRIVATAQAGNLLPKFPVVLDGLTREITRLLDREIAHLPQAIRNAAKSSGRSPFLEGGPGEVILVKDAKHRRQIIQDGSPKLVLASSGMLHAGASPAYARAWLPDPAAALLVVGYQDAESPGRRLLELQPGETLSLPGEGEGERTEVLVQASTGRFHLSAHADRVGLSALIGRRDPGRALLVHGEAGARSSLAKSLGGRLDTVLPAKLEPIELADSGRRRGSFINAAAAKARAQAESEGTLGGELPLPKKLRQPVRERHAKLAGQLVSHPDGLLIRLAPEDLPRLRDLLPDGFADDARGMQIKFEASRMETTRIKMSERMPTPGGKEEQAP